MTNDEQDWKTEALRGIGTTPEDVDAKTESRKLRVRDGGVCVCGHAARAHTEKVEPGESLIHDEYRAMGQNICFPSKAKCECNKYEQVLTAEDLRKFRHSTKGPNEEHALMQGVWASMKGNKAVHWIPTLACKVCHKPRGEVDLVPVAYRGREEASSSTNVNVMICTGCRADIAAGRV